MGNVLILFLLLISFVICTAEILILNARKLLDQKNPSIKNVLQVNIYYECYLLNSFTFFDTVTFSDSSFKVLVITGYPYDESKHSEVIDVGNKDSNYQDFIDFPYTVEGATGSIFHKEMVICGGYGGE